MAMQVILKEDVHNLGKAGELVKVKPGFGRNTLRNLDMALYKSLQRHIATHGEPADFDLPSKSELVDRDLAAVRPRTLCPGLVSCRWPVRPGSARWSG